MVNTGNHEEHPGTPRPARQEQAQSEYDGSLVLLDHLEKREMDRPELNFSTLMTKQRERGRVARTSTREQNTSRLAHRPCASSHAEIGERYEI